MRVSLIFKLNQLLAALSISSLFAIPRLCALATIRRYLFTTTFGLSVLTSAIPVYAAKHQVNCDVPGQSLAKALEVSKPGDAIVVHGVCRERITIMDGPLTFEGDGTWVMDGAGLAPNATEFNGLIAVDGAQGITVRDVTIRNGSGEGILGIHGASMVVQKARIEHNTSAGLALSNSAAEVVDSTIRHNGGGIDAFSNSTLIFRGAIDLSQNLEGGGLILNGNTLAEIRGGHLKANNNGGQGILVSTNSTLVSFGFQASQGTQLSTNNNQGIGIVIFNAVFFAHGGTSVVTSSGNAGAGMILVGGSINSPFGDAKFVVENNPVGIQFTEGAAALVTGGLTIKSNAVAGIQADNAASLTLVSIPANPSTIQSNGTDMILSFGTKSTIDGVTIGTMVCDTTVLSRGTKVCP